MREAEGESARRATLLLVIGAALGISAAVASLLDVRRGGLPDDAVAVVNGVSIRAADYARAVQALASDRRAPLREEDRRHVLSRLVDEELLVQYGIDLGLVRSDRRVRGDLVSAVLAAQVASVDGYEPTEEETRAFYAEQAEFFATPGRMRLAVLWVRGEPQRRQEEALARAREALRTLRGGRPFGDVASAFGDEPVAPLPNALLPPAKVREYLGPTAARKAISLAAGAISEPIVTGSGVYVLAMVEREEPRSPPLLEVQPQVVAEMKRRAGDDAVRATLDRLRREGEVIEAESLP